jgi:ankyrin repeat protein
MGIFDGYSAELRSRLVADDAVAVRRLLEQSRGIINKVDSSDGSLLHEAARFGAAKVCEALVDMGANVSLSDKGGSTPLHETLSLKNWRDGDVARFLIDRGADLGAGIRKGGTPLHEAILHDNVEAVDVLIRAGSRLDALSKWGSTPLHSAASGFYDHANRMCEMLLDAGSDIEVPDRNGWTALHTAAYFDRKSVCELLVARGANLSVLGCNCRKDQTPFQMAVSQGHGELVRWFIEVVGEDPNQTSLSGRSLLRTAKNGSSAKSLLLSLAAAREVSVAIEAGGGSLTHPATGRPPSFSPL